MKNMTDEQIGRWSVLKFGGTCNDQFRKYKEEYREMLFELADMWIVICGLKARGTIRAFPNYEEFCKQYSVEPKKLREFIDEKININNRAKYISKNGVLKRMKNAEEVKNIMIKLAKENGVAPSSTMEKIANFRARNNVDIKVCPCAPNDKERGCISKKCLKEIFETGTCHCRAFVKK